MDPDRFWSHVEKLPDGGCWKWTGRVDYLGYGHYRTRDFRTDSAHRISWMLLVGEIPPFRVLDHLCRNPGCVNPAHLEPVTSEENTVRGAVARGVLQPTSRWLQEPERTERRGMTLLYRAAQFVPVGPDPLKNWESLSDDELRELAAAGRKQARDREKAEAARRSAIAARGWVTRRKAQRARKRATT